jgi:hypothetical protein
MASAQLPQGLSRERDVDLERRAWHVWSRRGLLALVALVPVVALTNVLGQRATTATTAGPTAVFDVHAPTVLRGGLIYQTRFTVLARKPIENLHLVLSPGWFDGLTLNTTEPQPGREGSRDGSVSLSYGSLDPGKRLVAYLEWQANPTTVTHRSVEADVYDGGARLGHIHRTLTVLP